MKKFATASTLIVMALSLFAVSGVAVVTEKPAAADHPFLSHWGYNYDPYLESTTEIWDMVKLRAANWNSTDNDEVMRSKFRYASNDNSCTSRQGFVTVCGVNKDFQVENGCKIGVNSCWGWTKLYTDSSGHTNRAQIYVCKNCAFLTTDELKGQISHELGIALGIFHSGDVNAVMYDDKQDQKIFPIDHDRWAIRDLYRWKHPCNGEYTWGC